MTLSDLKKISKISIIEQVAEQLRNSIVDGDLRPGEHLREIDLAQQMGVSRGSVREALIRLEAEGLVESHVGRGSFVIELSEQDVAEIYDLRLLLEKEAVRLVTKKATDEQLQELLNLSEQTIAAGQQDDVSTILRVNAHFHGLIWEWAGNGRLCEMLKTYYRQVQLYLASSMHLQTHEHRMRTVNEHKEMVLAMVAREPETAAAVMQTHLQEAERLLRLFKNQHPTDGGNST